MTLTMGPGPYYGSANTAADAETFTATVPAGFSGWAIHESFPTAHRFEVYINGVLQRVCGDMQTPVILPDGESGIDGNNGYWGTWVSGGGDVLTIVATQNPGVAPGQRYGAAWSNENGPSKYVFKADPEYPEWSNTTLVNTWWYVADGGVAESWAIRDGDGSTVNPGTYYDKAIIDFVEDHFTNFIYDVQHPAKRVVDPEVWQGVANTFGVNNASGYSRGFSWGSIRGTGTPLRVYRVHYDPLYWNTALPLSEQSNQAYGLEDGYTVRDYIMGETFALFDSRSPIPVTEENKDKTDMGPKWGQAPGVSASGFYFSEGWFDQLWFGAPSFTALTGPDPLSGKLKIWTGLGWDEIGENPNKPGYPDALLKMWNGYSWSWEQPFILDLIPTGTKSVFWPNPGVGPKPLYVEDGGGEVVTTWMLPMGSESDPYNETSDPPVPPDANGRSPGDPILQHTHSGGHVNPGSQPIYNPWTSYSIDGTWADHMSYSLGGVDYPLPYGTDIQAPAAGTLHTSGGSGEFEAGWVGSAGRRSILYLDTPMKRTAQSYELGESYGNMVAIVFQHQSIFGVEGHYAEGDVIGWSGASADGLDIGGDVHLHVHGLTAAGARVDFLNFV